MKRSKNIFVVDDDRDIARLLKHVLTKAGFSVQCFGNAEEVIPRAEANVPHLFVLDVMLPGMNGIDLCKSIRKHELLRKIPILVLSAKCSARDKRSASEAGATDYLTKPFSPKELVLRVRGLSGDPIVS
jgi:two-component system, OmpR family, alkaline phosphatase synthesis response regulator PhoP